jgi:DNA-binding NtrC family response regulator
VLSDVNMPRIGGLEMLKPVRDHDLKIPVIFMTGTPTLGDVSDAMTYGAFRYQSKPLNRRVGVGIVVTPVSRGYAALFCPLRSEAAKLEKVDLVGMQLETEFPKSLGEILPE